MNKRHLSLVLALVLSATALFSCGDKEKEEAATTEADNWIDSIEYEGSFYVSAKTKLLYALDTGKITLWSTNGRGKVFQELEYDTTADDAMERLETMDFSGDGYGDIRIVYDEKEDLIRYNLWLWDVDAERFSMCTGYRDIENPEHVKDTNQVIGVFEEEGFGSVKKTFAFNETCGIDEIDSEILDRDSLANTVAQGLGLSDIKKSENVLTVNGEKCTLYESKTGYLAAAESGNWYADPHMSTLYRKVVFEDGAYKTGAYVGDMEKLGIIADSLSGTNSYIKPEANGRVGEKSAKLYAIYAENTIFGYLAVATDNYSNTNGIFFAQMTEIPERYVCKKIISNGDKYEIGDFATHDFEVQTEETAGGVPEDILEGLEEKTN